MKELRLARWKARAWPSINPASASAARSSTSEPMATPTLGSPASIEKTPYGRLQMEKGEPSPTGTHVVPTRGVTATL